MPYIWCERQKGKIEYRQSLTLLVWIRRLSLMHSNRRQLTTLRAKWSDIVDGLWWYRVVSFSFSSSSVQMWFCWRPVWSPKTWPNGFKWDNGGVEKTGSWITAVTLWVQWCTYSALLAFWLEDAYLSFHITCQWLRFEGIILGGKRMWRSCATKVHRICFALIIWERSDGT